MYIEKIESFMNFLEKRKVVSLYDRNVYILAMRERDLLKTHLMVEEVNYRQLCTNGILLSTNDSRVVAGSGRFPLYV